MKNQHNKDCGSTVDRSDERIKDTGEVFTPMELVYEMIAEIPTEIMRDKSKTFLDNSCGCGNFLVGLYTVLRKMRGKHKHTHDEAISRLYGIDMMEDNVQETCKRLNVPYPHDHFVVADGLTNPWEPELGALNGLLPN